MDIPELTLIPDSDPRLHTKVNGLVMPDTDLRGLATAMMTLMLEEGGIGLAAPQVGHMHRMFVMVVDKPLIVLNPRIIKQSKQLMLATEGCLSYMGELHDVPRPKHIDVSWQDLSRKRITSRLSGLSARCFLHEFDHLNGIVFRERTGGGD